MVLFAVLGTGFCEWFAEGKGQDICRSYKCDIIVYIQCIIYFIVIWSYCVRPAFYTCSNHYFALYSRPVLTSLP